MTDIAICVENLSKRYPKPAPGVKLEQHFYESLLTLSRGIALAVPVSGDFFFRATEWSFADVV